MKTIYVAKSVLGALGILTALGLSACSAKTSEQSAIGVTSEALTTNPNTSDAFAPFADTGADVLHGAAHCVLKDTGVFPAVYYMIALGGFDLAGHGSTRIEAFEPTAASGNGAWVSHAAGQPLDGIALPQGAGDGAAVTEGDGVACYYSGGSSWEWAHEGGMRDQAIKLTVNFGTFTLTSLGSMQTARSRHGIQLCGVPGWADEQRLIAYGGLTDFAEGTNKVEVFEGNSTWTNVPGALSYPVFDFASASLDASTNRSKIIVANGQRFPGNMVDLSWNIDTIYVSTPVCRPEDVWVRHLRSTTSGAFAYSSSQRTGAVAVPYDYGNGTEGFIVAAGDSASGLSTNVERIAMTSWLNSEGFTDPWNPLNSLVSHPVLVALPGGDFALVGGTDHGGNNALADVQKFTAASGGTWSSIGTLNKARSRHIAEYLPTVPFTATGIYVSSGVRFSGGSSFAFETQTEVF